MQGCWQHDPHERLSAANMMKRLGAIDISLYRAVFVTIPQLNDSSSSNTHDESDGLNAGTLPPKKHLHDGLDNDNLIQKSIELINNARIATLQLSTQHSLGFELTGTIVYFV
jgi:hypothetical protein